MESLSIILLIILGIFILVVAILLGVLFYTIQHPDCPAQSFSQNFGVKMDTSGNVLSKCGSNGISPCQFSKNTLSDALNECLNQGTLCEAFTFTFPVGSNTTGGIMQIIDPSSIFPLTGANIFIKNV